MQKAYSRINWENEKTLLNDEHLNRMDAGLDELDNRILEMHSAKLDKTIAYEMVKNIALNEDTGVFIVTYLNGSTLIIDTKLEKIAVNFRYDEVLQKFIMTLDDGTEQIVDMSALITQYEFADSATITCTISADGTLTHHIKAEAITEEMLSPEVSDKIKSGAIICKKSGTTIVATDSSDAGFEGFRTLGKSSQRTLTGKNLFDKSKVSYAAETATGFSFTNTGVTNSPHYIGNLRDLAPNLKVGDVVTHYGKAVNSTYGGGNSTFFYLSGTATDWYLGTFITITEADLAGAVSAYGVSGVVCEYNDVIITKKENASYEPYCGGVPSPNPEYPQPIVSVGQKRAEGKNVLDCSGLVEATSYGVTFTPVYDEEGNLKYINANGTNDGTADSVYRILNNTDGVFDSGDYILSYPKTGKKDVAVQLYNSTTADNQAFAYGNATSEPTFTYNGSDTVRLNIYVLRGYTVSNFRFYPMIRKASIVDGTYEPYTGGVKKAYDVGIEHKTVGKNLFNVNAVSRGLLKNNTGIVEAAYNWLTTDFLEVIGNVATLSVNNPSDNFIVRFCEYDSEKVFLKGTGNPVGVDGNESKTIELLSNTKYVRVSFGFDNRPCTVEEYIASGNVIQLEYGTVATPYQPYQSSSAILAKTLPGIPVTDAALANYTDETGQMWCADYVDIERKVWVQRVKRKVLTSDMQWYVSTTSAGVTWIYTNHIKDMYFVSEIADRKNTKVMCNFFSAGNVTGGEENTVAMWYGTGYCDYRLGFYSSQLQTVEDWKTFLDSNEVYVDYLATPIETPLTAEEIAAYKALRTYKPTTVITNDAGAYMEIEYVADTKNHIEQNYVPVTAFNDALERISALEQLHV